MLEKLSDVPDGIVGVKAIGRVTRKDYESVLDPLILGASREGRRLRFLYEIGPECEGFTPGAAWEDAKLGFHALGVFAACAVVTDHERIRQATRVAAFLLPCPVHAFPVCDRAKAIAWLGSVPHEVGVAHRLIADKGVLVIDAKRPLHTQDFDVLALTVDPWIEAHGGLEGIVIHARAFPGWESLGSIIRHVQFVRDHRAKVRRLAIAADGRLASMAPRLGDHFVNADLRVFTYDEVDAAITWAGLRAEGTGRATTNSDLHA